MTLDAEKDLGRIMNEAPWEDADVERFAVDADGAIDDLPGELL